MRKARIAGIGLAAAATVAAGVTMAMPASAAGASIQGLGSADAIADHYIVVLKDGVSAQSVDATSAKHGGTVTHKYTAALHGYAAQMSEQQAKDAAADPAVAYVTVDKKISISTDQLNPPSWGQDRVDQRDLPLDSKYSYSTDAANVNAYVIDTGIRTTHVTFEGRAKWETNTSGDGNNTDCNGHGTHVAGTIGGKEYGLAKKVTLHAVKVLNCQGSGSTSGVAAGIDWVTQHAVKPAVANMSLGGGADTTLDNAVKNSIASGVTYAIASGNSSANACNYSPARVPEAITVNASDNTDKQASFSNYGTCTDIYAPGVGITSSWGTGDTATNTISGTSMATPHVAGAAALYLSANPSASPQAVRDALVNNGTPNKISNPGTGSPNVLLYTGSGSTPPPPPPTGCSGTNANDVQIPDAGAAVYSSITIANCGRAASSTSKAEVHIKHTYRGDLVIDLIAPDGSSYRLKSSNGSDGTDNVDATYSANLSSEAADGTWKLKVQDVYSIDTGYIDTWTLTL